MGAGGDVFRLVFAACSMVMRTAYVVAARRTAIGRIGGLHKSRRVEDLAAPLVAEVLKDAGLSSAQVDRLILGNCTGDGNPARLVALTAGLPESIPAVTIDQQCASGAEAILSGIRTIATGEAELVVAGGVEALSMASWRIAKPRFVHQTPRFIDPLAADGADDMNSVEVGDALARTLKISRQQQDDYALRTHMRAGLAREAKRFIKEILPLRAVAEEARDQSAVEPELQELQEAPAFAPKGTLTAQNISAMHDGAAMVAIVAEPLWEKLGKPPGLQLVASASVGVAPMEAGSAAIVAMQRLAQRVKPLDPAGLELVELSEASAIEAIAFRNALGLTDEALNPDGGAIARGHPLGAASAVLVVRLFTRMARIKTQNRPTLGAIATSARGGLGLAALFEAV